MTTRVDEILEATSEVDEVVLVANPRRIRL